MSPESMPPRPLVLAAYVNTLTFSPLDKTHKVVSGIYWSDSLIAQRFEYIADIYAVATMPSPTSTCESKSRSPEAWRAYCIDERGDKRVATEALWLETFLCAVLRAYLYADDGSGDAIKKIVGVRRFNPVTNTEMEHKFLDAAEKLFFLGRLVLLMFVAVLVTNNAIGRQLSSDPETQVPNTVSNHLTSGILKYIHTTGRYTSGINLFEKLRTRDVEVSSLLARVQMMADEEVQAVRLDV